MDQEKVITPKESLAVENFSSYSKWMAENKENWKHCTFFTIFDYIHAIIMQ